MKFKFFIIILILLPLFLAPEASALPNSVENYYYVIAVGIDKGQNENEIAFSVQIATSSSSDDSSGGGSSQSSSSKIYTTNALSIGSAINTFNNFLSKSLSFSHCSAIIFSEEIAKEGITPYITTLSNNSEIRPTANVIVSNTSSVTAMESISNSDENFSAKLYEFIINSVQFTNYSIESEIRNFLYSLESDNASAIATHAIIKDDILQDIGFVAFDGDKMAASFNAPDSIAYSLINNNIESSTITIPDPFYKGKMIDISIIPQKDTKIKIDLVNGYPYVRIKAKFNCNIQSISDAFEYESAENILILEDAINSYLEDITLNFLYKIAHEYNLDIINFRKKLSNKFWTLEDLNKINWKNIYPHSYFKVDIESNVKYSGLLTNE